MTIHYNQSASRVKESFKMKVKARENASVNPRVHDTNVGKNDPTLGYGYSLRGKNLSNINADITAAHLPPMTEQDHAYINSGQLDKVQWQFSNDKKQADAEMSRLLDISVNEAWDKTMEKDAKLGTNLKDAPESVQEGILDLRYRGRDNLALDGNSYKDEGKGKTPSINQALREKRYGDVAGEIMYRSNKEADKAPGNDDRNASVARDMLNGLPAEERNKALKELREFEEKRSDSVNRVKQRYENRPNKNMPGIFDPSKREENLKGTTAPQNRPISEQQSSIFDGLGGNFNSAGSAVGGALKTASSAVAHAGKFALDTALNLDAATLAHLASSDPKTAVRAAADGALSRMHG